MSAHLTAAQFAAALDRAHRDHIRLRATSDPALFHATSSQTGAVAYAVRVDGDDAGQCSCPAGQSGQPCKHLAAAISAVAKRRDAEHRAALSAAGKLLSMEAARKRRMRQVVAMAAD